MKKLAWSRLLPFFQDVSVVRHWTIEDWSELLRFARAARILAQVEAILRCGGALEEAPEEGRWQLDSARIRSERACRQMVWEVSCLERALRGSDIPVVLLKGAAYQMGGFPWSNGRISVDVDILVPPDKLPQIESRLMLFGWVPQKKSPYDERFYRDWMHELPPLIHWNRGTELDIHHTLLPRTGKITIDPFRLWEETVFWQGNFSFLSPRDMVLHSLLHTFQDGPLSDCFRELLDLDRMLRYFSEQDVDFWEKLQNRIEEFRLYRPVFYAFGTLRRLLATPIPDAAFPHKRPGLWSRLGMELAIPRTIFPELPGREQISTLILRKGLLARQHWLRMPLKLLVPHLWHKWQEHRQEKREIT